MFKSTIEVTSEESARLVSNDDSHKLLWQFFEGDRRDFVYRQINDNFPYKYVVHSLEKPVSNDTASIKSEPLHDFRTGDLYIFSLRVDFSVQRQGKRHDLLKDHLKSNPQYEGDRGDLLQELAYKYMDTRSPGFEVMDMVAMNPQERTSKNRKYSSVDLRGILKVTDPEVFRDVLVQGIGARKAFGCGLLYLHQKV